MKIEEKFVISSARFFFLEADNFELFVELGRGSVERNEGNGLQSFPHSNKCLSSFYKYYWSDRLEIEGYGLALCKENFY